MTYQTADHSSFIEDRVPDEPGLAPEVFFQALGEAASLLAQSPAHDTLPVGALGDRIVPPLCRGQLRLWRGELHPTGLATWAWLDAPTEAAVLHEGHRLTGDEWACGPNLVLIDLVAPFGGSFRMIRDLTRRVLTGRAMTARRFGPGERSDRIIQFPGRDAEGTPVRAGFRRL